MDENLKKKPDAARANRVRELCYQGYQQFDQKDYKSALRKFYQAWTQLPKPQSQYQEATWVLTAIGDTYQAKGEFANAIEALNSALHCPSGANNPIIHLRLAQCHQQLGKKATADELFLKAYKIGGKQFILDNAPDQAHLLN